MITLRPRHVRILGSLALTFCLVFLLFYFSLPSIPTAAYVFHKTPRPSWLSTATPASPLIMRLAIITTVDDFKRREAMRNSFLRGLPRSLVSLEHVFVVGHKQYPPPSSAGLFGSMSSIDERVRKEHAQFGDMLILPLVDNLKHMSEKRYRAIQWGARTPHDQYDWFMTIDADTFCRIPALVRRLTVDERTNNIAPRKEPAMIARQFSHKVYFNYTVYDVAGVNGAVDHTAPEDADRSDVIFEGPWYPYPGGIGYLLR